jgi:hypothetical protein
MVHFPRHTLGRSQARGTSDAGHVQAPGAYVERAGQLEIPASMWRVQQDE